jgi:uncharacterized protein YjbJ (UPF0337 family)
MKLPIEQQANGTWKQFKGRVQEAWGVLTDDDLDRHEGQLDQLVGRIEEVTGETRAAIRRQIDKIAAEAKYEV